jgi:hypothetical protein
MNLRDGDRLAAIAILEPSTNGGGDESPSGLAEDIDEEVLAALPTQSDVAASEAEAAASDAEAGEDEQDEETVVDSNDETHNQA